MLDMKCWDEKDEYGVCQGEQDLRDAQDVCKILEIPFKQVHPPFPFPPSFPLLIVLKTGGVCEGVLA